ncbi:LysR family transcriptional regulator [Pelomonas sp. KK5]|uniref:LysR family transcriptional regulator n=1 Tax=Pelomonas sp. KK5 TaxID=1855730 RepID=UPI00097C3472|nr:LysR family transcriptional regulator [Pelomonas sp. KK5]
MDIRQLRYFVAVADAGHMTRAAATLGIQQPPLSQQVAALEARLGLRLFERHPKGVNLTDAGRLLLKEARHVLGEMETLERRMSAIAEGRRGELAVGFTSSAAAHRFTPQALRECRRQYPDIALALSENNAAGIIEAVQSSRLHCGLLRVPVQRPAELQFEPLLYEKVVVALPLDHPLARRTATGRPRTIKLAELRDTSLILVRRPGAPGLYANLMALCERQGFRPRVVAEVERMMTNLNLVASGAGISVVPASMVGTHADAISYHPLAGAASLDAPLTLVWRAADDSPATLRFIALLRQLAS